jgi:hypothetical protein
MSHLDDVRDEISIEMVFDDLIGATNIKIDQ